MTRAEIEAVARRVMRDDPRMDGLDDRAAVLVVLGAALPHGVSVEDQRSPSYVEEAFRSIARSVGVAVADVNAMCTVRSDAEERCVFRNDAPVRDGTAGGRPTLDELRARTERARSAWKTDSENAWREPLNRATEDEEDDGAAPGFDALRPR